MLPGCCKDKELTRLHDVLILSITSLPAAAPAQLCQAAVEAPPSWRSMLSFNVQDLENPVHGFVKLCCMKNVTANFKLKSHCHVATCGERLYTVCSRLSPLSLCCTGQAPRSLLC